MTELIKIENGTSLLDMEVSQKIVEFERQIKLIKEAEDALKEMIKAEMEARGILKVTDEANGMTISYVASTSRETFDSKKFKADNPDLFDEYVRFTPVKSSIRIKID